MTDDTNAALMYSILPSIGECCKSDPDTARKLREIFVKVEKHAPGFSEDFIGALHKGLSRPQFPYDATLLSLSGQDLKEFKMIKTEEEYHQLQQRSDTLKNILSSIPRVIDNRPVFLDTIKEIAGSIRNLLDVLKELIRTNSRNRQVSDALDRQKRDFVQASKHFSDSLKLYFQDRTRDQQHGVFKAANRLSQQTNILLIKINKLKT